jgi:hypothetical protein
MFVSKFQETRETYLPVEMVCDRCSKQMEEQDWGGILRWSTQFENADFVVKYRWPC